MNESLENLPAAEGLVDPSLSGAATTPGHDANPAPGSRQPQNAADSASEALSAANTDTPGPEQAVSVAVALDALKRHGRDPVTGQFVSGHLVNLKHGRRAPRLFDAPALAEALTARVEALERDYGGAGQLTTAEHALVVELGRLQLLTEAAGASLMALGLTTTTGKARAACSLWLGLLDRQSRLAGQLGLSRRTRPATDALAEWARATTEAHS
jgi:hypothetical protein